MPVRSENTTKRYRSGKHIAGHYKMCLDFNFVLCRQRTVRNLFLVFMTCLFYSISLLGAQIEYNTTPSRWSYLQKWYIPRCQEDWKLTLSEGADSWIVTQEIKQDRGRKGPKPNTDSTSKVNQGFMILLKFRTRSLKLSTAINIWKVLFLHLWKETLIVKRTQRMFPLIYSRASAIPQGQC